VAYWQAIVVNPNIDHLFFVAPKPFVISFYGVCTTTDTRKVPVPVPVHIPVLAESEAV
jgi:hypothetical protein